MKRWIFENLGLKLLACLIAIALWAYVGSRQVLERKMTLRLELTDVPLGMMVEANVKTTVPIIFTGRKESVLSLDPEELKAVVSLREFAPSSKALVIHPPVKVQPAVSGVVATTPNITVHLVPVINHEGKKK
jgi:hypothetical protein